MKQSGRESLRDCVSQLGQYREPLCFELSGTHIRLLMDTGESFSLHITSESAACWCQQSGSVCQCTCECLKLKQKLYLVCIQSPHCKPVAGLVLDLESGFAAVHLPGADILLVGAIVALGSKEGKPAVQAGRSLVGHSILWRCAARDLFAQTFVNSDTFSILFADPSGKPHLLPYTACYYPLREDNYLVAASTHNHGETILMLLDSNAMRSIGLTCLAELDVIDEPQCMLFSAYGTMIPPEENVQTAMADNDLRKYKKRVLGKKIYNPMTQQPIPGGLKQYVYPTTEELAGKTLDLRLDGQAPVLIHFLDATTLEWTFKEGLIQAETYECVKGDDAVYMIVCHPHGHEPASCVTLIWDRDTRLVTAVLAWDNLDAAYPRLVTSRACFGAEYRQGFPFPTIRHQYTEYLIGRRFVWHYTANDDVLHICFDQTHFRLGRASVELASNPSVEALAHYERLMRRTAKYPYYEELVYYIKIKEGLYLYSVIEYAMCRLLENQGGGELLALVNTARERYIGRSFGLDAQENAGHDIIGAPGCELEIPDEVESLPCPIYHG